MTEHVVGLSFDGGQIRAVELTSASRSRYEFKRAGSIAVPEGAMESGQIVDAAALSAALRELWADGGFKSRRVRLSIDGRLVLLRRTELPAASEFGLRRAAAYDISDLVNYDIAEAVFDVVVLDRFERGDVAWASVLVVSVAESVLQEFRAVFDAAGLKLADAEFVGDSIGSAIRLATQLDPDAVSVIVDIEDTVTSIFIRDSDGTLFARTISAGVGATALTIAEELESELSSLAGQNLLADGPEQRIAAGVSTVVEGVRRTLDYFTSEVEPRPLGSITVTGSRSHAIGLLTELEAATGLAVTAAEPIIEWPADDQSFAGFEVSLGAALTGNTTYQGARRLRLESEAHRSSKAHRKRVLLSAAITLMLALILCVDALSRRADADQLEQEAQVAERAANDIQTDLEQLAEVGASRQDLEQRERQVDDLLLQRMRYLDVLQEAAENMPASSQLISVQLRRTDVDGLPTGYVGPPVRGVVTFAGIAEDLDVVGSWLDQVDSGHFIEGLWLDQTVHGPIGDSGQEGSFFVVDGVITQAAGPEAVEQP